jgi:hypothetical protein
MFLIYSRRIRPILAVSEISEELLIPLLNDYLLSHKLDVIIKIMIKDNIIEVKTKIQHYIFNFEHLELHQGKK